MISHQRRVLIRTKIVRINWKTSLTLFSFSRLVRTTAIGRYSYSKYQSSESSNYPQKHHKWNPLGFEVASGADWQSSENSCWRTARLMEILLKATSHFWRCTECLGLLEFCLLRTSNIGTLIIIWCKNVSNQGLRVKLVWHSSLIGAKILQR